MMKKPLFPTILLAAAAAFPGQAAEPKSVKVDLSAPGPFFEGPGAEAMNANCTACHSAEMVHTQPALSKAAWQAEVAKMVKVYKASVNEDDIPAILDYLTRLRNPPS